MNMSKTDRSEVDSGVLSLDSFTINEMHLKSNPYPSKTTDHGKSPIVLNISCDSNLKSHTKDPLKYAIDAKYSIAPKGDYGWWMSVVVHGCFTCSSSIPQDERETTVYLYGHTLLWGTLRGYIISMSGPFSGGSIMLPTVDMLQLLRRQN
jgi:hypothetical protein